MGKARGRCPPCAAAALQATRGRHARQHHAREHKRERANPLQGTEITPTRRLGVGALGSFQLAISSGFPREVISAEYIPSARMRGQSVGRKGAGRRSQAALARKGGTAAVQLQWGLVMGAAEKKEVEKVGGAQAQPSHR